MEVSEYYDSVVTKYSQVPKVPVHKNIAGDDWLKKNSNKIFRRPLSQKFDEVNMGLSQVIGSDKRSGLAQRREIERKILKKRMTGAPVEKRLAVQRVFN